MTDKKNKGGAPTKYKEEYCEQARKLCILGATDKDIADFFNVTERTINNWKEEHPTFFQSIKDGKLYSDEKVVNALYHRAIGYELQEVKEEEGTNGTKTVTTKRQVAGDTTAQIFWLKNRRPEEWRDKQHVEADVTVSHEQWLDNLK